MACHFRLIMRPVVERHKVCVLEAYRMVYLQFGTGRITEMNWFGSTSWVPKGPQAKAGSPEDMNV